MRFIDEVIIDAKAGDGGNGAVAWRREKYVPMGGPSGADGGRGGDFILRADTQLGTLQDLYYAPIQHARNGDQGHGKLQNGNDGEDLVVRVPRGTVVSDADSDEVLADLVDDGDEYRLRGGRGGLGNSNFATSVRQAPDFATPGKPGQARRLRLTLKVLADVGLVGFPNAGKSTLLSVVSAARPKIADYPFTTLTPNLGVVKVKDGRTFVMADMPGLIEGASEGAGLGHQFLRHLSRVRVMLHLVEGGHRDGRDPIADYEIIRNELKSYSKEMAKLPELVVITKSDLPETADVEATMRPYLKKKRKQLYVISSATRDGLELLLRDVTDLVKKATTPKAKPRAETAGTAYSPHTPRSGTKKQSRRQSRQE